jgi:hypothetical protein
MLAWNPSGNEYGVVPSSSKRCGVLHLLRSSQCPDEHHEELQSITSLRRLLPTVSVSFKSVTRQNTIGARNSLPLNRILCGRVCKSCKPPPRLYISSCWITNTHSFTGAKYFERHPQLKDVLCEEWAYPRMLWTNVCQKANGYAGNSRHLHKDGQTLVDSKSWMTFDLRGLRC